jgi:TPR repeat protein
MESDTSALEPKETNANVKETTSTASKASSKSTSSSTGSSSTNPPHPHKEADACCVCLEDLQVDSQTFARMPCCGKAMHLHCKDRFFGSSLSRDQKNKCPHCQVKLPSTDEEHFERARGSADRGKAWAQAQLGNDYTFGKGVEQSYEKAIEYYTLAIQQSDASAMFGLADMYYHGQGVTKSIGKAIELYTQAANQGHASAQCSVGIMYYNGKGVDQSNELAREWWIKAAVQDQEQALQHLQMLDKQEGRTTPTILCCSTCGKPKTPLRPLKPCKLCHTVQYCGRDCQVHHWKKGGHRRECRTLREATATATAKAENKPAPKKDNDEDEDANDGKEQTTTTTSTTSATTTTTSTSAPLPPQQVDNENATKCKTKENNDDGLNKKETTTTTAFSSTTTATALASPPSLHRQADTCCVCLDDLQVDDSTFARMTCCGKATHLHCTDRFFGSSLSREQKNKCPHCQVNLVSTNEETVERARGWADKGKAWAQAQLGNAYSFGKGVEQSYEKAIEYCTLAIQNGDPNAMFGLATMYERGIGVKRSIGKAVELYTQAANQGHASAQFNLGCMYITGEGVDQSNDIARELWIKAAVQDHENALQNLQILDKEEGRTTPTILCCSTCGKPKTPLRPLKPCKLCHTVQYCGRECQINHWKEGGHRKECKKLREAAAAAAKTVPKQVE